MATKHRTHSAVAFLVIAGLILVAGSLAMQFFGESAWVFRATALLVGATALVIGVQPYLPNSFRKPMQQSLQNQSTKTAISARTETKMSKSKKTFGFAVSKKPQTSNLSKHQSVDQQVSESKVIELEKEICDLQEQLNGAHFLWQKSCRENYTLSRQNKTLRLNIDELRQLLAETRETRSPEPQQEDFYGEMAGLDFTLDEEPSTLPERRWTALGR